MFQKGAHAAFSKLIFLKRFSTSQIKTCFFATRGIPHLTDCAEYGLLNYLWDNDVSVVFPPHFGERRPGYCSGFVLRCFDVLLVQAEYLCLGLT